MIPDLTRTLALATLLVSAAPAAFAQSEATQGRTGPAAAPPRVPGYAQPAPALAPPPPSEGPRRPAEPDTGLVLSQVRVAGDAPAVRALPPKGWSPPASPDPGLSLEHQPGQALDEAWVRGQFARNGLPGAGGVGRALALVQLINRAYLSAGFINSGVVVRPSASLDVLELQVVYGGLAAPSEGGEAITVDWTGGRSKGLRPGYVRKRMAAADHRPLSAIELERDFRLLAEDPAIRTINADLRPGARPGQASLALTVLPQDRFDLYVTGANNRSPSVGGERVALGGSMRNLVAAGDIVSAEAGVTDGVEDVAVSYATPFLSPHNTLALRAAANDAAVTDTLLQPLDIKAKDRWAEAGLTRKLVDTPLLPSARDGRWTSARTVTAGALVTWRTSKSSLLGEPFSFAPGAVNGRTEYAALRLVGDYVVRNVDRVFAISATGSLGLYGTGSDVPGVGVPSEHFKVVLAQVNYARRLTPGGLEVRARVYGQWAGGLLYSGERLSAGGESTVRGYRENLLLADRGVVGSVELARPVRLSRRQEAMRGFDWGAFTVSAFVDGALLRNAKLPQPEHEIYSLGGTLAWTPSDAVSARVTYGYALKDVESAGRRDIQDRGLQFRLTIHPLRMFR